mgnify:CR=1 FL=1
MTVFVFDNYEEFGLFFKINSGRLLSLSSTPEFHEKINEYVKIFNHTKGGCGCNISKRKRVAASQYESFVPEFFTSPIPMIGRDLEISNGQNSPLGVSVVVAVKNMLGNPVSVHFKREAADADPFFKI